MDYEVQKDNGEGLEAENWLGSLSESNQRLKISLTNDFAFKTTFRNKKALTGLLSALLGIDVSASFSILGREKSFLCC